MSGDFNWRCNILDCREELKQQAVVTTCSHILCLACAEKTGLATPNNGVRVCPACGMRLKNQDDAVITQLDPSEDYKTSVLSGLSPTIIMECAGRGLSFYSYQVNQEIFYQSHLACNFRKKYNGINQQLDTVITQANSQIKKLQDALAETDRKYVDLENKNLDLRNAFKDKNRAFQQLQKQYTELKGEKMRNQAMDAASEAAENVTARNRFSNKSVSHAVYSRSLGANYEGAGQLYGRPQSGSSESAHGLRAQRTGGQTWQTSRQPSRGYTSQSMPLFATPSTHRTRLPVPNQGTHGRSSLDVEGVTGDGRQPLNSLDPNSMGAPPLSGFGMSAGMKTGMSRTLNRDIPRISRTGIPPEFGLR